jgi:hypothetical protein
VGRGDAAAGDPRGGAGIQALRPARARLITGTGALAALGGAGAYGTVTGEAIPGVAAAGCIAGLILLALGLVLRWPTTIPWAVILTGAGYVATRHGASLVDAWASVVGVLLLLAAELASWSIAHDARIRAEPDLVLRRTGTLVALAAVALLLDFLLLAAAAVSSSAGLLIAAAGAAAAVSAVAVVLRLVRA